MTSAHTPPASSRSLSGLGLRVDVFMALVALLAVSSTGLTGYIELATSAGDVDWILFTVIAGLLVFSEAKATAWVRFGNAGIITPSWAFSFALILLGSPTGAIAATGVASVIADVLARKPWIKVVFNCTQICLSVAVGSLVLFAFGIHGPLFSDSTLSADRALAMLLSGLALFVTNGFVIRVLLALIERTNLTTMLRENFALTLSADAAMLALAPIVAVTARQSLLLLPMIATATFFVYTTAREAIARAHEANHDVLTQLLNRRSFIGELDAFVIQPGRLGSVMMLDLDKFKEVNDRLGHHVGDLVLQEFGARLAAHLDDAAIVARLGGDEFAVLLPDVDPVAAIIAARRLHADLQDPLEIEGFPISAGTSIGIAHHPAHGSNPTELMHAADVAMYRSKRFRSGVECFEAVSSTQQRGRLGLLNDVEAALTNGEFSLEYQPQVDLDSGAMSAVEALLRWNHPTHGRVGPDEFISLAEHTDLIGPVTDFVIERTITEFGLHTPDETRLSVNVSSRNLQDRFFAQRVLDLLERHGVSPTRLDIEITESAVAADPELAAVSIGALRSAGVRIFVDDFGTGYSSFAVLRDVGIDGVKIDRSFVTNIHRLEADRAIVSAIITMVHGLGLVAIAEGIESDTVADVLRSLGCDIGQGYLFGRPQSADELIHTAWQPHELLADDAALERTG